MIPNIRTARRTRRSLMQAILLWLFLFLPAAGPAIAAGPQPAPGAVREIVARVNGDPVTRDEVQRLLDDPLARRRFQKEQGDRVPDEKEAKRLVLREVIHRRLLLQEAGRRKFTVTGKEIDQALSELRSRFRDLGSFGAWMHDRGLDDRSLFDTLRAQILTGRVWSELAGEVRLTEEEVGAYYEKHKEDLAIGEEVRLRIIAVRSDADAREILMALRKGGNFSRLARERSLGMRAVQGGDSGWVDFRTLPVPLQRTVAGLKAGEATGPVQKGADEFLVVGMQARRPVLAKNPAEARPEVERRLLPEKQRKVVQEWLTEKEKNSEIEIFERPLSLTNGKGTGEGGRGGT